MSVSYFTLLVAWPDTCRRNPAHDSVVLQSGVGLKNLSEIV
jgi:hypothetical protein